MTHEIDDVLAANRAFYAAFKARDINKMSGVWSYNNAACLHPGRAPITDREQIMESWREIFEGEALDISPANEKVIFIDNDVAVVLCEEDIAGAYPRMPQEAEVLIASNVFLRAYSVHGFLLAVHHAGRKA
jgi:ketosteroid isomerase-like protein